MWSVFWTPLGFLCHFLTSAVEGVFNPLVSSKYGERLPSDYFFALLVAIFLDDSDALLWRRSYIQVFETYNSDLLHEPSASFISQASFPRSVSQGIFAENTWIGRCVLRWTSMMLHFQQNSSTAHLSFGLPLLRLLVFILVEITYSADEQRHNLVGDYLQLLNLCVNKQRKGRRFDFHCSESQTWSLKGGSSAFQ